MNNDTKIEAIMNRKTFKGYGGEAAFFKMHWEEFISYCAGALLVSIGEGKFRSEVSNILRLAIAYEDYYTYKNSLKNQTTRAKTQSKKKK